MLLNREMVQESNNVQLVLGQVRKEKANPLFVEDRPWEPRFDNLYANVLYDRDEQLYKCWYSPFVDDVNTSTTPKHLRKQKPWRGSKVEMGLCYATSKDGLHWEKPELGLVEFNGSKANNLLLRAVDGVGEPHGTGVYKDDHDPDPARRYKMLFNRFDRSQPQDSPRFRYMCVGFSRDGIHWNDFVECPDIQAPGDTHSNWFWAPSLGRYVGITRLISARPTRRLVARTESKDFVKWTKAVEIFRALPSEPNRQTYAMPAFPYADGYLGLLMMINKNGREDTVDCELAWSADSISWERVCPGTPMIPRGPEGAYDSQCLYGAFRPVVLDDEIRLYYGGNNGEHTDYRDGFFCLARLRPDGFAGYEPGNSGSPGRILTAKTLAGGRLSVSADASGGRLVTRVLDSSGKLLAQSEPVVENVSTAPLRWKGLKDLSRFRGSQVQLEFSLDKSRLYAFTWS